MASWRTHFRVIPPNYWVDEPRTSNARYAVTAAHKRWTWPLGQNLQNPQARRPNHLLKRKLQARHRTREDRMRAYEAGRKDPTILRNTEAEREVHSGIVTRQCPKPHSQTQLQPVHTDSPRPKSPKDGLLPRKKMLHDRPTPGPHQIKPH